MNYPDRCRHFHGVHKFCAAGIDPHTVRDTSGKGMARWPCLTILGQAPCATTCEKRVLMTAEEHAAEDAALNAATGKFFADLAAGNCPHCGAKVERRKQVGPCVYAKPCGHRLGQGRA